jgi:hypothetical protein
MYHVHVIGQAGISSERGCRIQSRCWCVVMLKTVVSSQLLVTEYNSV